MASWSGEVAEKLRADGKLSPIYAADQLDVIVAADDGYERIG